MKKVIVDGVEIAKTSANPKITGGYHECDKGYTWVEDQQKCVKDPLPVDPTHP